jgi:hypothetical protein
MNSIGLRPARAALFALVLLRVSSLGTSNAWAESVQSVSPTDGFWDVGSNWSTEQVAAPNDDVLIDTPTPSTVTIRSGTHSVRSLRSTNPVMLSGGSLRKEGLGSNLRREDTPTQHQPGRKPETRSRSA